MENIMFYVYKIKNLINNKLYIGKADNVNKRWLKHISYARTNRGFIFHKAITKYGADNFEVSILEECESEEIALEKEAYWIAEYKTNICKWGSEFGYNLTDGGEGISGHKHSDESKQKMSDASIGKPKSDDHKNQLSISHTGKILSEEHRASISLSNMGKIMSDSARNNIRISKLGEKNPKSILTENDVREIKLLFLDPLILNKDIATKYGVAPRTIRDIKNNKTWKHIK